MSANLVNVGISPNDGSGDALRTAMQKINGMFTEIYSTPVVNTQITVGNTTVNSLITNTSISIQNTSANAFVANTTGVFVSTNTFNLGSNSNAANGYTYLPNGFKINWGWVSANSTDGNAVFASAFTTNAYSVMATSNTAVNTYGAGVISQNNTVAAIRTANATSTNVHYIAIGY